jgi:hypothetical protein
VALAANEPSLLARTSAPVTCLNVTRKGTASRIWELRSNVKTNVQRSAFGVQRSAFGVRPGISLASLNGQLEDSSPIGQLAPARAPDIARRTVNSERRTKSSIQSFRSTLRLRKRSSIGEPKKLVRGEISSNWGVPPNVVRRTPNVERSYPEWERIFDKNCWARSVPGEPKKSALGRSSTISPWSMNITRLATSLANPIS